MADDYQMMEELGSGSFGIVYRALCKRTGLSVAIKHIDLEGSADQASRELVGLHASRIVSLATTQ
nr:hypothetical protein B0A51_08058 [Rachicladosporium sp. CCFEE 5018]